MTGEPNNPTPGTDNAEPISETDNPSEFDYYDPEEDNVAAVPEGGTDDETQTTEPAAEVQEEIPAEVVDEVEPQADEGEQTTEPVGEDAVVKMADGTEATVKDLIAGNMRQADHTRKSQENSNLRKKLETDAAQIEGITNAFVDYLTSLVPEDPPPGLASTDYQRFLAQKAQHDAGMAQIEKLIQLGAQPKEITDGHAKEDHKTQMEEQNRMLALAVPETATKDGRQKFFNDVQAVAAEVGFTKNEATQITDHRVFLLAQLAKEGIDARTAKVKVREKVAQAAPATPRKPGQAAKQANSNVSAMRRLSQTGSIEDAMNIDFE